MTDNITEKDKKDWENFLSKKEKLPNKDIKIDKKITFKTRSIDLHGYSLEEANKSIENFIVTSYQEKINKFFLERVWGANRTPPPTAKKGPKSAKNGPQNWTKNW